MGPLPPAAKEIIVPQEQEQRKTQRKGGGDAEGENDAGQAQTSEKGEQLKEEMDDILEEIDSVLEENAEEFIKSYVQKGGE
jgi:prokaryotic ubiquitin-like protein Pup